MPRPGSGVGIFLSQAVQAVQAVPLQSTAVFRQPFVEGDAVDAKDAGGGGDVAPARADNAQDVAAFDFRKRGQGPTSRHVSSTTSLNMDTSPYETADDAPGCLPQQPLARILRGKCTFGCHDNANNLRNTVNKGNLPPEIP